MFSGIHILGAHKAGTTRLYEILSSHPKITGTSPKQHLYFYNTPIGRVSSKAFRKETNIGSGLFVDATPDHLCNEYCLKAIDKIDENRLGLISLRNPVDRSYSHWCMTQGYLNKKDFLSVRDGSIIERSKYSQQVKNAKFMNNINLNVEIFELWKSNEKDLVNQIAFKLKIDNEFSFDKASYNTTYRNPHIKRFVHLIPKIIKKHLNKKFRSIFRQKLSMIGRKVSLKYEERLQIADMFKYDVEELSKILKFDLSTVWKEFK